MKDEGRETDSEGRETNPDPSRPAPTRRSIVDIGDAAICEFRRSSKETNANERKNRRVALLAVLVAGAVAAIGIWQACLTRQANQTIQSQLRLSERPWVSVALPTLRILSPLTFKKGAGFITIAGEMRNTGHSVALRTMSYIRIIDVTQLPRDAQMRNPRLCGAPRNATQKAGYTLFPGDSAPITQEAEFYPKDIQKALLHSPIRGRVTPFVVVCLQYQSTFERTYHVSQYGFFLRNLMDVASFEPKGAIQNLHLLHAFFGDWAN